MNTFSLRTLTLLVVAIMPLAVHAKDCSGLPTSFHGNEFPSGDFFSNFDNHCYTVNLASGYGSTKYGDLNAVYYQLYYKVDPRYQLILVGTFPNTRYFSVSLNDEHSLLSGSLLDVNMVPLTNQYKNPYGPGVAFVDGQKYAVPINFGGSVGSTETGCSMTGYNIQPNAMDATLRHPGMDWNNDSGMFQLNPHFPPHVVDTPQHTNPTKAGVLMIRAYVNATPGSYATNPHVIVRDVASGCAYPADYALHTLQMVVQSSTEGGNWMDHVQHQAHDNYETDYLPNLCMARVANPNTVRWSRQKQYVPATNPDASYLTAPLPRNLPTTLASAGEVMRIRVRVPTAPPTPCTNGCSRSGNEQMRYMSLSFTVPGGQTIASLADSYFTKDPDGYATLIVATGATVPSWVTPANGYTFLDLTSLTNWQQLVLLSVRHVLPSPGFMCAGQYLPYRMAVDSPSGSLVGDYVPVVDYPLAATLPGTATPLIGPSTCDSFPAALAGERPACSVLPEPPIAIQGVATECPTAGCTNFVAQNNPPIIITGAGFGVFPKGAPFTGTSQYLRIVNKTRQWSVGYTGNACTVSISSWADNMIQLIANANSAECPLVAGDIVLVEVWNPQTMSTVKKQVTVAAN